MTILLPTPHLEDSLLQRGRLSSLDPTPIPVSTRLTKPPAPVETPTNHQSPVTKKPMDATYSRHIARINSLEKTIEFQKEMHHETTRSLTEEISRLQTLCSELTLKLMLSGASKDSVSLNDPDFRNAVLAALAQTIRAEDKGTKADPKTGLKGFRMGALQQDVSKEGSGDSPPIYLLVEKEKRKYQGMIERLTEENKKKSNDLQKLHSDMNTIRDVLSIAGVKFDMKEFQKLSEKKVLIRKKSFASWPKVLQTDMFKTKLAVLPPISGDDDLKNPSLPDKAAAEKNLSDESCNNRRLNAPPIPPTERKGSGKLRAARYVIRPDPSTQDDLETVCGSDVHNPNLDYDHRTENKKSMGKFERKRVPSNSASLTSWGEDSAILKQEISTSVSDGHTVLDDIIPAVDMSKLNDSTRKDESYSQKVLRARFIREKQWRNAADQAK